MPRPSRLRIPVPADFWLPTAACSYGYFLLAPGGWSPEEMTLHRTWNGAQFGLPDEFFAARVVQPAGRGTPLTVACDRSVSRPALAAVRLGISRMLRLDKDLRCWRRLCPAAARRGFGRMFRSPTLFEDMVKTITNCNVGWPSTVRMNRLLVERVGDGAFPTAPALARWTPSRLQRSCKVGYRAKRIVGLARKFVCGELHEGSFDGLATEEIRERLLALDGFGPYAAANVLQLLGHDDELPIDTETYRLYCKQTGAERPKDPKRLDAAIHARYEPYRPHRFLAYWFELWRDYERQRGDAWTWDQQTTGTSFTAAQLD